MIALALLLAAASPDPCATTDLDACALHLVEKAAAEAKPEPLPPPPPADNTLERLLREDLRRVRLRMERVRSRLVHEADGLRRARLARRLHRLEGEALDLERAARRAR